MQVLPLQRNDFTHTLRTHSLEVSGIGRSIRNYLEQWLVAEKVDSSLAKQIPSLLSVTCLIHDIGNTPFGHYGEDIIRAWFKNLLMLSPKQMQ